jgi:hypothetical protein
MFGLLEHTQPDYLNVLFSGVDLKNTGEHQWAGCLHAASKYQNFLPLP